MVRFDPVQLEWYCHTLSARSSAYGIQPIWPSEYASFNVGKRTSTPENKKSASDAIELLNDNMMSVSGGASGDAAGIFDDDPMCMQSTVRVSLAQRKQRIPVARMNARQTEVRRNLAEADRPRAPGRVAGDLGHREIHVPERDDAERNQVAVRLRAPVLDHPVVVRTNTFQPELEVAAFHERLPAESRERREGKRAVDPHEREIVDARLRFVAPRPHLFVRHRGDVHLAAIEAANVAVGCGVERDRDVALVHVDQAILVEPVVTPAAVLGHLLLVRRADVE